MIYDGSKYLAEIIKLSDKSDLIGNNPFTKSYVYLENNRVVAFLVYDDIYDRIEIVYIYTDINFRRKNIASKLLNKLISEYENYQNITLEVRSNNFSAIKLYEKYGFKKVAIRKNYYGNKDGILMQR